MASLINSDNGVSSGSAGLKSSADSSGVLQLQTNGTAALTVDTSQNVGIGTASPASKLDVTATIRAVSSTAVAPTSGKGVEVWYDSSGDFGRIATYDRTGAAYKNQYIDGAALYLNSQSSGNVGIGTSSPTEKCHIYASSGNAFYRFQNAATGSGASDGGFVGIGSSGDVYLYNYEASNTIFATNNSEKMRIEAAGNLCVGVTGNYLNGRIVGFHATSGYYTFRSDSSLAAATSWGHFYGTSGSNTVANISIYGNGSIQNATGSYAAYSDIKLKENIVDATPKLADLMQVRIRNYNLKGELGYDTSKQIGVIAQELEEVFPGLIEEAPDRDSEGNELGTTTKGVKYSIFIPMLIKAMQEQQALITQLQADVAALKGKA